MLEYVIWFPNVILFIGIVFGLGRAFKSNSNLKSIREQNENLKKYQYINGKYRKYATCSTRVATGRINVVENEYIKEKEIMFP